MQITPKKSGFFLMSVTDSKLTHVILFLFLTFCFLPPKCNILSLIQAKVVNPTTSFALLSLEAKLNYSLFCLALAPKKSMNIPLSHIFWVAEVARTRVATSCRFLHSRSHMMFLLDPVLNLCQHFLYKSLF